MSFSLNRAQLIGNATRDCETRQTPQGRSVASFGVATNFTWKDSSGSQQNKAEFHNVVVWGRLAEICAQYVKKGRKIFVEGRLQTRDWQGDDGVKRSRTEIIATQVILLDRPGGTDLGMAPRQEKAMKTEDPFADLEVSSEKETQPAGSIDDVSSEDLPF